PRCLRLRSFAAEDRIVRLRRPFVGTPDQIVEDAPAADVLIEDPGDVVGGDSTIQRRARSCENRGDREEKSALPGADLADEDVRPLAAPAEAALPAELHRRLEAAAAYAGDKLGVQRRRALLLAALRPAADDDPVAFGWGHRLLAQRLAGIRGHAGDRSRLLRDVRHRLAPGAAAEGDEGVDDRPQDLGVELVRRVAPVKEEIAAQLRP